MKNLFIKINLYINFFSFRTKPVQKITVPTANKELPKKITNSKTYFRFSAKKKEILLLIIGKTGKNFKFNPRKMEK